MTVKTVVVTGGTKGIGRGIVDLYLSKGWRVAVLDIELPDSLPESAKYMFLRVDISRESEVKEAADQIVKQWGWPNVLINNAGVFPRKAVVDMDYADFIKVVSINLGGSFLCAKIFGTQMLKTGVGCIINIASGRALQGAKHGVHYSSSKHAIIGLTRSLALEWAPTIRVNTVVPGITDTDQPRELFKTDEALYARGASIPLGRIGQVDDIAKVVYFLSSDASSYMTGQSVCVNGGSIML